MIFTCFEKAHGIQKQVVIYTSLDKVFNQPMRTSSVGLSLGM
jgi:hypothetical protein